MVAPTTRRTNRSSSGRIRRVISKDDEFAGSSTEPTLKTCASSDHSERTSQLSPPSLYDSEEPGTKGPMKRPWKSRMQSMLHTKPKTPASSNNEPKKLQPRKLGRKQISSRPDNESSKRKASKPNRRVHFSNKAVNGFDCSINSSDRFNEDIGQSDLTIDIQYTIQRSDYTKEEKSSSFFEEEEVVRMIEKCRVILKNERGLNYCTRGLENLTKEGMSISSKNRGEAYDAVLGCQEEHRNKEICNNSNSNTGSGLRGRLTKSLSNQGSGLRNGMKAVARTFSSKKVRLGSKDSNASSEKAAFFTKDETPATNTKTMKQRHEEAQEIADRYSVISRRSQKRACDTAKVDASVASRIIANSRLFEPTLTPLSPRTQRRRKLTLADFDNNKNGSNHNTNGKKIGRQMPVGWEQ